MSTWHDVPELRINQMKHDLVGVNANIERFMADAYRRGVVDGKERELDRLIGELKRAAAEEAPTSTGVVAALLARIAADWSRE